MPTEFTDKHLLTELSPVVEENLARHIAEADGWLPHDLVPWDQGKNFAFMGGTDWSADQSTLSEVEALALTVGVLVADNVPAYHREIAKHLAMVGPWWRWVGRWTAEENRHSIVLRNYLMVTRAVDPVALERARMDEMVRGYAMPPMHLLEMLANSAFEEKAAAVRHHNTAALAEDPLVASIETRLAADDELQSVFYRNVVEAAFAVAPEQMVRAIASRIDAFDVPSVELPGGKNSTAVLAEAGIYDPALQREKVFAPLLAAWNIAGRSDLGTEGEKAREELSALL
ncbi:MULTISPECIES: acyl-ACP desaturase [Rhodococcus]|jgi:acyl-[acyl-carrier-protein] desaturase|uniref:Acyl-ACP desaturase n=1 Tax=Rhodococcus oxybenzonivorans TaxID=1990687 RepID=A0AAE5A568_9NOCA|nr:MULTISPECIES: acyl-ACP desaturase [Rhodococcus]MDV7246549.1 acyl-ACP desaturase [Rhodococcus oxybenzonivorans]MDV7264545.1 acyl-ACP desaturase [Rhodococcus oxybenzonivorans]MDV7278171.1 acyl-ACP desaturase [Rhodococcus oxybenzonivorans]MDV7337516.1 acyl-ACP desaturase [Rhodococcus oxybenzonivorans]MDV7347759.1 acyl-ACP desaturase [Rhodococcus oxybenzonivorans]